MTAVPDLSTYSYLLINSSGGKDSQAMLTHVVSLADKAGIGRDRLVVVHADLGRVEWPGTRDIAARQAAAYGLRFEVVRRDKGDLLQQVEQRRMWPSSTARYCSSDQKTSQVTKLMTRIVREHREACGPAPVRILNCLGIRAEESPARAKKAPFHRDSASNGRRHVDRWLPIFDWSAAHVWHPAYDVGMPRLSCVFCVLAGRHELVLAARLNPALAADYAATEARIGHRFRADLSMAQITAAAAADPASQGQDPENSLVRASERVAP